MDNPVGPFVTLACTAHGRTYAFGCKACDWIEDGLRSGLPMRFGDEDNG